MEGQGRDASGGLLPSRRSSALLSPAPFLGRAALCAAAAPIDSHYLFFLAVVQLQGGEGVRNSGGASSLKYTDCSQHWPDIMYPYPASPLLTKPTIVCRLNRCPPPRPITTNIPLHRYQSVRKTALFNF